MSRLHTCPSCLATLPLDAFSGAHDRVCPKCRAPVPSRAEEVNPYAAPASSSAETWVDEASAFPIPPTFFGKFGVALQLFIDRLPIIAALVFTIWLPPNLVIGFLTFQSEDFDPRAAIQLSNVVSGLLAPIYTAGILYALSRRMYGEKVSFLSAFGEGFHNWGRLFGARLVAGIIILVGLIAFIIPGIIVAVRYALLDAVVVFEHSSEPRERSAMLVKGRWWEILGANALFFALLIPASIAIQAIPPMVEELNNIWVDTIASCIVHLLGAGITVLMFVYYWETSGRAGRSPEACALEPAEDAEDADITL